MKRTFFVAIATLMSLTALADDYTLYITTPAAVSTFAYDDLHRITFADGNVVVATHSGDVSTFPIADISRMSFEAPATGIQTARQNSGIAFDGQNLSLDGTAGRVEVFTPSGAVALRANAADGQSINLSQLPRGIYVVKAGGKATKIIKK